MGIQINGNTNNINAGIGSLSIEDIRELDITGIATASNFKTGTSNVHSTGYECTNVNATGVITATSFVGSGANLTGITGTTINNNADNRVITGSGTANTLEGEANLLFDGSSLSIGGKNTLSSSSIITYSPDSSVRYQMGVNNTDGVSLLSKNTSGSYNTYQIDANTFRVRTTGTNSPAERLTISSDGNVCVGGHSAALSTYNSTQPRLSVYKSSGSGGYLELGGNIPHNGHSSGTILFINNDNSEATSNNANGKILAMQRVENVTSDTNAGDDMGGDLVFMTKPEAGSLNERLRINSNGSVSIANTRNYYGALNVEAGVITSGSSAIDIKASGSGSYAQAISFGDHNTISGELKIKNSTDITLGTSSNHPFVLLGNNVAGLKISNSNGRLERNFGAGSGHTADGMWFNNSVSTTGNFIRFWQTSGSYGANQIGSITHSAYNTAYNTSSDYRLKENDVKISDGITRLKQLRPIRFNWKSDPSTTEDGFFAHEAAMVVPEAVTGTKDEVADSDSPDIGQKAGEPIHQGMDYGKITPLLTAALQEAITRIETLEQQKIDLEAQVAAIVDSITNK